MAKYDVTYKCGHETVVNLVGKSDQRQYKISRMESDLCPNCEAKAYAERNNMEIVEVHYSEYKSDYANCQTVTDSYNSQTKTILVIVPIKKNPTETQVEMTFAPLNHSIQRL